MARDPDRTPTGELLLAPSAKGRSYHASIGGMAACALNTPVAGVKPISQVPQRERCERRQCHAHTQREGRGLATAADAEHVCPVCFVERDKTTALCPNCQSTYMAIPAVLAA